MLFKNIFQVTKAKLSGARKKICRHDWHLMNKSEVAKGHEPIYRCNKCNKYQR